MKPQVTQDRSEPSQYAWQHDCRSSVPGGPLRWRALRHRCVGLLALGVLAATGYAVYRLSAGAEQSAAAKSGIGLNPFTGTSVEVHEGAVLVVPGLHELRRFSRRDQVYRPVDGVERQRPRLPSRQWKAFHWASTSRRATRSTRSRSRRWPGICPRT
jgi:hypothetical protein